MIKRVVKNEDIEPTKLYAFDIIFTSVSTEFFVGIIFGK